MYRCVSFIVASVLLLSVALSPRASALRADDKDAARLRQEIKRLQGDLGELRQKLAAKEKQLNAAQANARDAERDAQVAMQKLRAITEDLRGDIRKLQAELKERTTKLAEATGRADKLAKQLQDIQDDPIQNPPAGKVSGTVKRVDDKTGQVVISVGGEAGLRKGHTLEAYRDKPKHIYLGVVQVTEVRPKEAVVKLRFRPKGAPALQAGDAVADQVLRE
jgi:seryl-tRNA synthetase